MFQIIRSIFPFVRPFWKFALGAALCSIPLAAIKTYQAYFVKEIFDKGLSSKTTFEEAVIMAMTLLGLQVVNYPFRFFHFYGMRVSMDRAVCNIRRQLYSKFQRLPLSYFAKNKQGNLLANTMSDTQVLAEAFKHSVDLVREPLTALGLISVAVYQDWQLTLIIVLISPMFIVIFNKSGKLVRKYVGQVQEQVAQMTHDISEGLQGQKIIKAFNLQDYVLSRFDKSQEKYLIGQNKNSWVEEHSHPLVELVGAIGFAGVIIFAHHRIASGALTTGGFISFVASLALFMDPIRKFSSANVRVNQARAAGSRIFDILALPDEKNDGTKELVNFQHEIEFRDVSFSYGEMTVVKNFNLTIKKGQRIGLVGLSGSGKSTLVSLLLRLYPVSSGKILVDGVDLQDYTLESLRKTFALVSQDIFLFNDTIEENLSTGKHYSDEELSRALEISYAGQFISELPQKNQTIIGDRGTRLSGGQCQRLTIARAFLRDCPVLLFDEATSALDNESEKIVQAALDRVAGHKTVIAVAHRLSTIQDYDRIVVMKDGLKIEEGSHQELMDNKAEYFKLYELSKRS